MSFTPRKTIIVPIDFSDSSAASVRVGLDLADDVGRVHVIHVIPTLDPISPVGIWGDKNAQEQLATTALTHLETFLASHEITGVTAAVEIGQDANCIVKYADEHSADLIVISSHGHSGLKRALLGSVAERVIRHAHCPVLVLRRQDAD